MSRPLAASGIALALPALFGLFACTGAPVQQMSNARQTITAARAAGAQDHAPDHLATASDLLRRAEQALQQHDYRLARRQAEEALRHAQTALQLTSSPGKPR